MTIEEEIRQRLRAMGMDEDSLEPCLSHIKADPLCRGLRYLWQAEPKNWETTNSVWEVCKSSALDYLEKKYHMEARKSPVTLECDGEEERTCLNE